MNNLKRWGLWAFSGLIGAVACSGSVHDVGDLNGAAGKGVGGAGAAGAGDVEDSGEAGQIGQTGGRGGSVGGRGGSVGSNLGGFAGSVPYVPQGGDGGAPAEGTLECPDCVLVADGHDIRSVAVDNDHVYWSEYGTFDDFHSYNSDGRLLSRPLDGGETKVLSDSLPGPTTIGVSDKYIYVLANEDINDSVSASVMRVPLAGGPAELIESKPLAGAPFTFAPGHVYWPAYNDPSGGSLRRSSESGSFTPETFVQRAGFYLVADATRLYFLQNEVLWFAALSDGALTEVGEAKGISSIVLSGDYFYAREGASPLAYVDRLPKAGGSWKRVAKLDGRDFWEQTVIEGDKFVVDQPRGDVRRLVQGSLTSLKLVTLASQPFYDGNYNWRGWKLSRVGVLLATSDGLFRTPLK